MYLIYMDKYINQILSKNEDMMLNNMLLNNPSHVYLKNVISYNKFKNKKYISDKNKLEEYIYKKPWNRLNSKIKKSKLLIYINKSILKVDNFEEIKHKLLDEFNNDNLNSSKKVTYDIISGMILNINGLIYKDNKYYYE